MKRKLSLLLVIFLALSFATACGKKDLEEKPEITSIPVETIKAEKGDFNKAILLSGLLKAKKEVVVTPKVMGGEKLLQFNLEVGDRVAKGATLAVLDNESLTIQLENARLNADDLEKNLERNKVLHEMGAVSDQQLEQTELALKQARNAIRAQELALGDTVVKAPISGVITDVLAEEGSIVSMQSPLCKIADISSLELETNVNEMQINKIKTGSKVQVYIPSANDSVVEGIVKSINPVMDQTKKAYPLTISLTNPEGKIKAGMYAEVELVTDSRKDVLLLPAEAIVSRDDNHRVFVIEDKKALAREVKLGLNNGRKTEILEGLKAGEEVVTVGNEDLVEGDFVTVLNRGEE